MPYQALLFDLDNTLIDFTRSEELSLNAVHQNFFQQQVEFELFREHYHTINKTLWKQVEAGQLATAEVKHERFRLLLETLRLMHDHKEVAEHYENGLVDHAAWYPGVKETLQKLKKNFQLGIITNGLGYVQQGKFSALQLQELCECYVVSELVGIAKPDKIIFDVALKQLNVTTEKVLMIGDSLASDYQGALNAGIDFCWINQQNNVLPADLPIPKYTINSVNELINKL